MQQSHCQWDLLSGGAEYPIALCECYAHGSVHAPTQLEDQEVDAPWSLRGDDVGMSEVGKALRRDKSAIGDSRSSRQT